MSDKFSKPVAFNKSKAIDVAILEYVKKRNFSGYVKKLIIADMKNNGICIPSTNAPIKQNVDNGKQSKLDLLKQQLAKRIDDNSQRNSNS